MSKLYTCLLQCFLQEFYSVQTLHVHITDTDYTFCSTDWFTTGPEIHVSACYYSNLGICHVYIYIHLYMYTCTCMYSTIIVCEYLHDTCLSNITGAQFFIYTCTCMYVHKVYIV